MNKNYMKYKFILIINYMFNIYLPPELINIILGNINDTKTYCNCRLVCKNWYNRLKTGKIFKYNFLSKKVLFKHNLIEYLDVNNKLIGSVIFKNYGYYIYKDKFNEIINSPFKFKKKYTSINHIEYINYNILTDKKTTKYVALPSCSIS